MKKAAVLFAAAICVIVMLCGCENEPEYVNPVAADPAYTTFTHEGFSFSYPVSCSDVGKEGYLLYCTKGENAQQVFGVKAEASSINSSAAVTETVINELCEKIIADTLPTYQSSAEKYGVSVTRDNFSYTIDSLEHIICGTEEAARVFYTVRFEHDAFSPVVMSFCNVWVFDEELVYLVTFCDVTGTSVSESFADCINYIFCD